MIPAPFFFIDEDCQILGVDLQKIIDMLIDKEYPATHSMDTSWFCVDDNGEVAIFDVEANGPVPDGVSQGNVAADLIFNEVLVPEGGILRSNLTDQQVLDFFEDKWETVPARDTYWGDPVFMIDTSKRQIFLNYFADQKVEQEDMDKYEHKLRPVCLSYSLGIYLVDLDAFEFGEGLSNPHARFLFDNHIVLKFADAGFIDLDIYDRTPTVCPYYVYGNDWDPTFPHERLTVPKHPVKLEQMPEEIRKSIIRIPVQFRDAESVCFAKECLSYAGAYDFLLNEHRCAYYPMKMPDGGEVFVLNDMMDEEDRQALGLKSFEEQTAYLKQFPLSLTPEEVERLKALPINKDFRKDE